MNYSDTDHDCPKRTSVPSIWNGIIVDFRRPLLCQFLSAIGNEASRDFIWQWLRFAWSAYISNFYLWRSPLQLAILNNESWDLHERMMYAASGLEFFLAEGDIHT